MKIGILGSGFGLYGYLPAVCKNLWTPIILEKKRAVIESRPELIQYRKKILYVIDREELVENSNALVVATTPRFQTEFLQASYDFKNINHFFLEKPISTTPTNYFGLIQLLKSKKINFSVGYLLMYASWYSKLKSLLVNKKYINIEFNWNVKKLESMWKNDTLEGGGLLSFYGIHFLALLKFLNFPEDSIVISENDMGIFIKATQIQNNTIQFLISYSDKSYFSVKLRENKKVIIIFENQTPFGAQNQLGTEDTRVNLITNYLKKSYINSSDYSNLDIELYIYKVLANFEENRSTSIHN